MTITLDLVPMWNVLCDIVVAVVCFYMIVGGVFAAFYDKEMKQSDWASNFIWIAIAIVIAAIKWA